MNTIDISIITLNYKEESLTKTCVEKLLVSKKANFEIIVINNSITEKSKRELRKISNKKVKIISPEKNLGCAAGYNLGIKNAKGKYVFILNNDTQIKDSLALYKMKTYLDNNKRIGVIQPKIKSLSKLECFEYAGAAGGFLDVLGYPFCRGRIFNVIERDIKQYNKSTDITWASTCAFFARKSVVEKAGLFDPIYFAYAEEVDISLKIWNIGYKVCFFPQTEVFHKGETSWKKVRGRKTFLIHRNHLILYFKCFPMRTIIANLPLRILFEFASMLYYIKENSYLHIVPVFASYISLLLLIPRIYEGRKQFFAHGYSKENKIYNKSVVLQHFLYKKNCFSNLSKSDFGGIT